MKGIREQEQQQDVNTFKHLFNNMKQVKIKKREKLMEKKKKNLPYLDFSCNFDELSIQDVKREIRRRIDLVRKHEIDPWSLIDYLKEAMHGGVIEFPSEIFILFYEDEVPFDEIIDFLDKNLDSL